MRFIFKAHREESGWVAMWSGEVSRVGVIITESATREELEANVKDAIETFLYNTFEIIEE